VIVKKFEAKGVFGYIDFNILFNEDVSFLIGGNGSGKTTALKLMNALLKPNFKDLFQIPFDNCSIVIKSDDQNITITSKKDNEKIHLSISGIDEFLLLPSISGNEINYFNHREEKFDELIDDITRRNVEHPVVKAISKIDTPIFLGLDRRRDMSDNKSDYYLERELWIKNKNSSQNSRRLITGQNGISLIETEMLVLNSYRRIRDLEDRKSIKLRDKILLSSFQYSKFNQEEFETERWKPKEEEKRRLLERQKEITDAISKIVGENSTLNAEVNKFFDSIRDLFDSFNGTGGGISIEWLLNKAQIERMSTLVDIIDEHKSAIDKLYKPINDFLNMVNDFYRDSAKSLKIDAVGQLLVVRPDGKECTIEGLSSGERQLFVIFAHAFFNHYVNKKSVFIIDEPELSLHMSWQEKFAETIFSVSPNSQFILATHSPEIVAGNKNKAVKCR